jgi:hypothetical protein
MAAVYKSVLHRKELQMDTELRLVTGPRVLGSPGPAEIVTDGSWLTRAKVAYYNKRDTEAARREELVIALANMLYDLFGEAMYIERGQMTEPSVVLRPSGHRFGIVEHLLPGEERVLRLTVGVPCGFCERENEQEFETLEELGEILCEPTGGCAHCGKPLVARPGAAS